MYTDRTDTFFVFRVTALATKKQGKNASISYGLPSILNSVLLSVKGVQDQYVIRFF